MREGYTGRNGLENGDDTLCILNDKLLSTNFLINKLLGISDNVS